MAKISPVSIKYMIYAEMEAEGTVEKPDVIGAIFGQTEGLLGSDLEMRDLQKEGKIGRIEVSLESDNGKTKGKIQIPSALDKTETALIAAAMETIERIGPSNAKVKIDKIEDVRKSKRDYILERAKGLLGDVEDSMPKTREIAAELKTGARVNRIREYGKEKLPAGNIDSDEIIIVEGRADVVNLVGNGVDNVIGMDGTKLPETIKELSYNKKITLFIDGDRGGRLIAKNVVDNARIDFIATAPDGKEVEELSGKEILTSLRKKIPVREFFSGRAGRGFSGWEKRKIMPGGAEREERFGRQEGEEKFRGTERGERFGRIDKEEEREEEEKGREEETGKKTGKSLSENKAELKKYLSDVEDTKKVLILDCDLKVIGSSQIRGIFSSLDRVKNKAYVIVADTATPSVIKAAEECNVDSVVANNFSSVRETKVNLVSL